MIRHVFDGHVNVCELQSEITGVRTRRFRHEITEKPTSSYSDINDYWRKVAGLDISDFEIDDNFDGDLDYVTPCPPLLSPQNNPQSGRFKPCTEDDINHLKAQNTEKTTDKQTKWAVKLLKGILQHLSMQNVIKMSFLSHQAVL